MNRGTSLPGPPVLKVSGDMGILIEFGAIYDPVINNAVTAFDAALNADLPLGVIETVPSFRSVLVRFDPGVLAFERLHGLLADLAASRDWYRAPPAASRRVWNLPVVYGGEHGPDLAEVGDLMGLGADAVAEAHAGAVLRVAMLGFSPGLAYLGQLPEAWDFPRRTTIAPRVPAGAILVAVRQTVLPGTDIPTGWHWIGQTPFRSFDVNAAQPFRLTPGDEVRFHAIDAAGFARFDNAAFLKGQGL
ncbi:MAG: allophanate hydrolase subunit 1 [Rhodobacteraceae bacterium]|nr:allophanate hydrolase subunit 1 [Paracoccaceae bacterium]